MFGGSEPLESEAEIFPRSATRHGEYGRENSACTSAHGKQCRTSLVDVASAVPVNAIRQDLILDRLLRIR